MPGNLELQLQREVARFDVFSLALGESCDVRDTSQLLVFVRGIKDLKMTEELAAMRSMKFTNSMYRSSLTDDHLSVLLRISTSRATENPRLTEANSALKIGQFRDFPRLLKMANSVIGRFCQRAKTL